MLHNLLHQFKCCHLYVLIAYFAKASIIAIAGAVVGFALFGDRKGTLKTTASVLAALAARKIPYTLLPVKV